MIHYFIRFIIKGERFKDLSALEKSAAFTFLKEQFTAFPEFLRYPFVVASFFYSLFLKTFGKNFYQISKKIPFLKDYVDGVEVIANYSVYANIITTNEPEEITEYKKKELKENHTYDVCVIGSGPGGALTSKLLSENNCEVVWLEEGKYYPFVPERSFSLEEMIYKYRCRGMTVAYGNPPISYVEGFCVGGGSEVNSALYHRAPENILDDWKKTYHTENLQFEDLRKYFETTEKELNVRLCPPSKIPQASWKLHEGAQKLGWKSIETPRWYRYENEDNVHTDTKQSMTETYVKDALKAGTQLYSNTQVTKITKERDTWITHTSKGNIRSRFVFVCAGAIQTPLIMLRSGFKKNIGEQLQCHPTFKIIAQYNHHINYENAGVSVHQVKEFPLMSFGCSVSSIPYLALGLSDAPKALETLKDHWQKQSIFYGMIKPEGTGRIRRIGNWNNPLVTYALTQKDLANIRLGMNRLFQMLEASGAEKFYPSIKNFGELQKDINTNIFSRVTPKQMRLMTIHLFSSCPMGENVQQCAVDSYGKVHGTEGLYINDASMIPTALGCNPQGTILAIARRNVHHFLETTQC